MPTSTPIERIVLHDTQAKAFTSSKRVIAAVSGIQGGKTFCGALWLQDKVCKLQREPRGNYIVTAPDYKILNQATLPTFMDRFRHYGKLNKADMIFELNNGERVYLRSVSNPDAIEGIPKTKAIWADEAGLYKYKAIVNIDGRASPLGAQIMYTTTPYALNALYKHVYKPWRDGQRDDVDIFQWRSIDNPHFNGSLKNGGIGIRG